VDLFANERYAKIVEMLRGRSTVTVSELMKLFGVSIETVRRDLQYLEGQHVLKRVHGGAVSNHKMKSFAKLDERMSENKQLKQQIAQIALPFIHDGDTIAIDSGSTAMELVPLLKERRQRLTIITNSPEVFGSLCNTEGFQLILIGGQYLREERAFYGHIAMDAINRLHFSKAFIFPSSVSLMNGIGVFVHELFDIQRAYINNADEVFILADSTKFETSATIKLCDLSPSFNLITDSGMSEHTYKLYKENGFQIRKSEE
jgi:DeoR/GlpR family transcriptional regulator of sugar metabolism